MVADGVVGDLVVAVQAAALVAVLQVGIAALPS